MLRMLQVPELRRAMGFDENYRIDIGTRRERIKLLGNGVCPPVMQAVVQSLTGGRKVSKTQKRILAPRGASPRQAAAC